MFHFRKKKELFSWILVIVFWTLYFWQAMDMNGDGEVYMYIYLMLYQLQKNVWNYPNNVKVNILNFLNRSCFAQKIFVSDIRCQCANQIHHTVFAAEYQTYGDPTRSRKYEYVVKLLILDCFKTSSSCWLPFVLHTLLSCLWKLQSFSISSIYEAWLIVWSQVSQDEFISYCMKKPSVKNYTTTTVL